MLGLRSLAAKIFGTTNDRKVAKYQDRVAAINAAETEVEAGMPVWLPGLAAVIGAALLVGGSCFHSVAGKNSTLWDAAAFAVAKAWAID